MPTAKVIVNADDFGRSEGTNRGIVHAHESGIVTSASLMVRWPAAVAAAAYAREHTRLSVGLHVDLGEWTIVKDTWQPSYLVVDPNDVVGIENEIQSQLEQFRQLMGCNPTHLDSHQHIHRQKSIESVLMAHARVMGLKLRHCPSTPGIRYSGEFYGQDKLGSTHTDWISPESMIRILTALPEGITELACHPAKAADFDSMYSHERLIECETLCHESVKEAIRREGISLISFRDVPPVDS